MDAARRQKIALIFAGAALLAIIAPFTAYMLSPSLQWSVVQWRMTTTIPFFPRGDVRNASRDFARRWPSSPEAWRAWGLVIAIEDDAGQARRDIDEAREAARRLSPDPADETRREALEDINWGVSNRALERMEPETLELMIDVCREYGEVPAQAEADAPWSRGQHGLVASYKMHIDGVEDATQRAAVDAFFGHAAGRLIESSKDHPVPELYLFAYLLCICQGSPAVGGCDERIGELATDMVAVAGPGWKARGAANALKNLLMDPMHLHPASVEGFGEVSAERWEDFVDWEMQRWIGSDWKDLIATTDQLDRWEFISAGTTADLRLLTGSIEEQTEMAFSTFGNGELSNQDPTGEEQ